MVGSGTSPSSVSSRTVDQSAPSVRREPLKRRGLSQFYVSKSQSFNCMSDLLSQSAFSRSTLLLAKRSSSFHKQSCSSTIAEDMSECTSPRVPTPPILMADVQQSPFSNCCLARHSWDGSSDSSQSSPDPFAACSLHSSLSASEPQPLQHVLSSQQLHQQQWQQDGAAAEATLGQASSLSSSSMAEDSSCWSEDGGTTDSLCVALQTTSLAAPQGLYGIASTHVLPHGFAVMVGNDMQ